MLTKKVVLKKPPHGSLRLGHPWIFRNQVEDISGGAAPGDLVDVMTVQGKFLGRGYFNPQSEIHVRLLSRQDVTIDKDFLKAKIKRAIEFRKRFVTDTNAFRMISSEADDLPGLIADQYADVWVVQFLTMGMEKLRPLVLEAIQEIAEPRGIYERSDASTRRLEGLEDRTGWILKNCGDDVVVYERDLQIGVQFGAGHKTGLYLDQRENRFLLRDLAIKGRALDAFCYEGGFGLHLALAGCQVLGIDIQEEALGRAREHQKRNRIDSDRIQFKAANVFEELKALEQKNEKFDLVILDPPSFVKKKTALDGAVSGYKEILLRAMKILTDGGFLAVFSCSYHVDDNILMQTAMTAAADVRKSLKLLKFLKQSADHPINPFIPETYYLKGFLFEVRSL